jgi:hypothetical protein
MIRFPSPVTLTLPISMITLGLLSILSLAAWKFSGKGKSFWASGMHIRNSMCCLGRRQIATCHSADHYCDFLTCDPQKTILSEFSSVHQVHSCTKRSLCISQYRIDTHHEQQTLTWMSILQKHSFWLALDMHVFRHFYQGDRTNFLSNYCPL